MLFLVSSFLFYYSFILVNFLSFVNQSDSLSIRYMYNSGGAGYVLDDVSLSLVAESFLHDPDYCLSRTETSVEDVYMANCLRRLGVLPLETRDDHHRERFHHFSPADSWHYR